MRYECPRCNETGDIEWNISGYNLVSAIIRWKCDGCKLPMFMEITFPEKGKKGKAKLKIGADDINYIG